MSPEGHVRPSGNIDYIINEVDNVGTSAVNVKQFTVLLESISVFTRSEHKEMRRHPENL